MPIDTTARRRLAEMLRHLVSGVVTNYQFDDAEPKSDDEAVVAVFEQAWCLYDDLHEHRMTGDWAVPQKSRRTIARWIVFLHSELPYEWPEWRLIGPRTWSRCLRGFLTLGVSTRLDRARFEMAGDYDVWPFFRRQDCDNAQKQPLLLRGAA